MPAAALFLWLLGTGFLLRAPWFVPATLIADVVDGDELATGALILAAAASALPCRIERREVAAIQLQLDQRRSVRATIE